MLIYNVSPSDTLLFWKTWLLISQIMLFSSGETHCCKSIELVILKVHRLSQRLFCASVLVTSSLTSRFSYSRCHGDDTRTHLQTVAAFIICHTEADLHADCTCMNEHTHTHITSVFFVRFSFLFPFVLLFVFFFCIFFFLHFILPDIPLVLGVFSSRIL